MNTKKMKLIGIVLMLVGFVGAGVTAFSIQGVYSSEVTSSASALAEAISGTMLPAYFGTLLALAGLLLWVFGWWRGRTTNQLTVRPA